MRQIPPAAHLVSGPRLILRGLILRCPVCGGGGLFKRWFNLKPHCPTCGFYFDREPGWYIGAMIVSTAASMTVFALAFALGVWLTWPTVPWGVLTIGNLVLVGLFHIAFYPFSKTIWLATDLIMHRMDIGVR